VTTRRRPLSLRQRLADAEATLRLVRCEWARDRKLLIQLSEHVRELANNQIVKHAMLLKMCGQWDRADRKLRKLQKGKDSP
jgi:hypothetical protein